MELLGYIVADQHGRTVKMTKSLRSALYHVNKCEGEIWADYGTGCMVSDSVIIWEAGRGTPAYDNHKNYDCL